MSDDRLAVISINQDDAVGLIELLELVEPWLATAGPAIGASFARFVGAECEHYPLAELRSDLISWAARLATAPGSTGERPGGSGVARRARSAAAPAATTHIRAAAPELIATARAQRWEPAEVLKALFAAEVAGRERSALATRRGAAALPTGKTFDAWDQARSSIPAPTTSALRTLEWVGRAESLVVCGPAGTGKTFLLEALGQVAVEAGMKVAWLSLESLGMLVRRHRGDDTVTKAIARILRAQIVMVDDIGLLPVGPDAAEGLYRLVDAAYERTSVAVSSNLHPSAFDELMPKTLATATVDRLLHHAHLCATTGDSVRLSEALSGHGVVPLDPARSGGTTTAPRGGRHGR